MGFSLTATVYADDPQQALVRQCRAELMGIQNNPLHHTYEGYWKYFVAETGLLSGALLHHFSNWSFNNSELNTWGSSLRRGASPEDLEIDPSTTYDLLMQRFGVLGELGPEVLWKDYWTNKSPLNYPKAKFLEIHAKLQEIHHRYDKKVFYSFLRRVLAWSWVTNSDRAAISEFQNEPQKRMFPAFLVGAVGLIVSVLSGAGDTYAPQTAIFTFQWASAATLATLVGVHYEYFLARFRLPFRSLWYRLRYRQPPREIRNYKSPLTLPHVTNEAIHEIHARYDKKEDEVKDNQEGYDPILAMKDFETLSMRLAFASSLSQIDLSSITESSRDNLQAVLEGLKSESRLAGKIQFTISKILTALKILHQADPDMDEEVYASVLVLASNLRDHASKIKLVLSQKEDQIRLLYQERVAENIGVSLELLADGNH